MALPTTILSAAGLMGRHPPYKSSGGAFYAVARKDADELEVYKASDPTDSWTLTDTGDSPVHAGTILGFDALQDGDVIHIVAWASDRHEYYTFDMSTDQWVVDEAVTDTDIQSTPPAFPWASISVRSDGDVVVVYAGETDAIMGNEKERVDVNVRTSGTWSGPTSLGAGGDVHYGNPNCILGTNDGVHCVWAMTDVTASDPPTSWNHFEGRTLDSGDTLSTVSTSNLQASRPLVGMPNLVTYDDGGTQQISIMQLFFFASRYSTAHVYKATEDGGDDISVPATWVTAGFSGNDAHVGGEFGVFTFAELDGDIHLLWSGGGASIPVDQDLYYMTSTDNGDTWSGHTEEIDGITVNFISANIYERGSDIVLAYVYDDAGVQKYNEKDIGDVAEPSGRIMSSLVKSGGLAGSGGIAGSGGGLAA